MSSPRKSITPAPNEQKTTTPPETIFEEFLTKDINHLVSLDGSRWAFSVNGKTDVFYVEAKDPTRKVLHSTRMSDASLFSIQPISKEYLAIISDKTAFVWDIKKSKCIYDFYTAYNSGILFIPSTDSFILAAEGGIYNLQLSQNDNATHQTSCLATGVHAQDIIALPSQKQFVTRNYHKICYWDQSWKLIHQEKCKFISSLIAIPDTDYLVSADDAGTIKLWNATSRQLMDKLVMTKEFTTLNFLPDKQHFIVSHYDDIYSNTCKLLLMKIEDAKLVNCGVIRDDVTCYSIRENGDIDVITSDSDKLRRIHVMTMLLSSELQKHLPCSRDLTNLIASYHCFFPSATKTQIAEQKQSVEHEAKISPVV